MNMHQSMTELERQQVSYREIRDRIDAAQHRAVHLFPATSASVSAYLSSKYDGYLHLISEEQYFHSETMLEAALRILSKYRDVTLALVRGDARTKWMVKIRRELVVYFREVLGKSFPQIASFLRKDHTSIMHLYRTAKQEQAFAA
ncbi:Chromosomal replication initiator protein DnaA [compost metagenome]